MAEDLQYLIDRIQKDAIDKADSGATSILTAAKEKAARRNRSAGSEILGELTKQTGRAITRNLSNTIGRQLVRGILGSIFGGKRS